MQNLDKKFRFRSFPVYTDTRALVIKIFDLTENSFPKDQLYILTSQIRRAMLSVLLNIAEGADRGTDKDFAHFLNNAHTSLNEVVACLDVALDLGFIETNSYVEFISRLAELANQITAFRSKLLSDTKKE